MSKSLSKLFGAAAVSLMLATASWTVQAQTVKERPYYCDLIWLMEEYPENWYLMWLVNGCYLYPESEARMTRSLLRVR